MRNALTDMQTTDDKVVCVAIKSVNLFSALDTDGKEALTISIQKCLWILEKQNCGYLSSYAQVNFPK